MPTAVRRLRPEPNRRRQAAALTSAGPPARSLFRGRPCSFTSNEIGDHGICELAKVLDYCPHLVELSYVALTPACLKPALSLP